jgi:membrane protein DedA with SNARE-associated domain
VLVYVAWFFGGQIDNVIKYARRTEHGILVAIVILAVIVVVRLLKRRKQRLARMAAAAPE